MNADSDSRPPAVDRSHLVRTVTRLLAELGLREGEVLENVQSSLRNADLESGSISSALQELTAECARIESAIAREAGSTNPATPQLATEITATTPAVQDPAATVSHHVDSSSERESSPDRIGDYEILDEVARGGMGVVYRARQTKLNRIVALKMIQAAEFASPEQIKRFQNEAEAAANLNHRGIVPVYDVGELGGQHYFSMAFVDGECLASKVNREGPLAPQLAAQLMAEIASAIDHAHREGVIHRDIKPHNVLLGKDGQAGVTDFGLAKLQESNSELTSHGQVLGTPAYMPPEQALGDVAQVGVSADVYSLGATFYFLLTGRPPFQASNVRDTLRQVLEAQPVPPRRLNTSIPRDLETICLKALAKEPGGRYQSALLLAEDLERWLNGSPIRARRITAAERGWKWCRRNPIVAGLTTTVLLFAIVGPVWVWYRGNVEHANGLVDQLATAEPDAVPSLIKEIESHAYWTEPHLRQTSVGESKGTIADQLARRVRLALASSDPSLADALIDDLLSAEILEIGNTCDALRRSSAVGTNRLWSVLRSMDSSDQNDSDAERYRAAIGIIRMDIDRPKLEADEYRFLVEQTLDLEPSLQLEIWNQLDSAKSELLLVMENVFLDRSRKTLDRIYVANAIARYAASDEVLLSRLLCEATPEQYGILFRQYRQVATRKSTDPLHELVERQPSEALSVAEKIDLGRRRAKAAITLLRMGERESVFDVFRYEEDPEAMTQFVHHCQLLEVQPVELVECFELVNEERGPFESRDKTNDQEIYAILLSLGEYEFEELPDSRIELVSELEQIYEHDPSSAVHSASGWLLRSYDATEVVRRIDQTPKPYDPEGHWEWFVEEIENRSGPQAPQPQLRKSI